MGGGSGGKVASKRLPRGRISVAHSSIFQNRNNGDIIKRTCFNFRISRSILLSPSPALFCGQQILNDLMATGFPLYRPFQTSAAPPRACACDPSVSIPSSITYEDGSLACARHILLRRMNDFLCSLFVFSFELVARDSFGLNGFRKQCAGMKDMRGSCLPAQGRLTFPLLPNDR